jgi:hypothetical protein
MAAKQQLLPAKEPFFPEGSGIMLVVHVGIGLFFIIGYFLFYSNIETIKMMIIGYYTLFNVFFLFFYYRQLRVRRIYLVWVVIALIQLVFYFINVNNQSWSKWSVSNVLTTLTGLPVVLALYQAFRRMSLQRENKDLVIGIRSQFKPSTWDIAATILIPLIALILCLA